MDLDDKLIIFNDYLDKLESTDVLLQRAVTRERFSTAVKIQREYKRLNAEMTDFYLSNFDSQGRQVVAEVYKVLGYNPTR